MKKLLVLLLTVVLSCSLLLTLSGCSTQVGALRDEVAKIKNYQNTFEHEGLVYVEINDGAEYSLVDYTDNKMTSVTIPSVVNGKNVTSIGPYAFYNSSKLVTLKFEADSHIKTIEKFAFSGLSYLRTLSGKLPASIEEIQIGAFAETRFQNIEFEDGSLLKTLSDRAFSGCVRLSKIVLPEGLETIGDYVFENCSALKTINIPSTVASIGDWCFYACDGLLRSSVQVQLDGDVYKAVSGDTLVDFANNAVSYDNAYYVGNAQNPFLVLINASSKDITSCTINENTKFVCGPSFYACKNLEEILIPASVESIGAYAFCQCEALKKVTLAENSKLKNLGKYAFYKCDVLEINEVESFLN